MESMPEECVCSGPHVIILSIFIYLLFFFSSSILSLVFNEDEFVLKFGKMNFFNYYFLLKSRNSVCSSTDEMVSKGQNIPSIDF